MSPCVFHRRFPVGIGSTVAAVLLLAAACGTGVDNQPDTMARAIEDPETSTVAPVPSTEVQTTEAAADHTADQDDEPRQTQSRSQAGTTVITTDVFSAVDLSGPAETADTDDQTNPSAEPFWDVELLGISMVGTGEYVRLTDPGTGGSDELASEPVHDEDTECGLGWLGYLDNGQLHRYEDLGPIGHPRLFNGPRGQDAIVVSCEESVERVLIQGSAVVPEDGVPQFTVFDLGRPHVMSFDADLGWRGDLFGGHAWRDGFDELVYFDTGSDAIVEAATVIGTRMEQLDHGFDIVVPNGWEVLTYEAAAVTLAIAPPEAGSYVSVLSLASAGDPEFPENAELLDFWTDDVHLWDYVSVDRGTILGSQTRSNWRLSHEGGTLVVQHLEAGDHHLIVHYFVAAGEDVYWELAQAITDQIRHYQYATVG